jgi:NAD(P)-dependent dehydrogenase (short-subunit alcohol dehydrogenase family)
MNIARRSAHLRKQFETNVFGLMDVTTAFLPHLRSSTLDPTLVVVGSRSAWRTENPVSVPALHDMRI